MLHCPKCGRQYAAGTQTCTEDGAPLRADSTIVADIPVDSLIGRVLDNKYRLDERLGEGGMGTVYRATHLLIDRPVAVKVLNSRFVEDEAAQERFRREARAAGRLQHTNAVTVTDFGRTVDGLVYIVMELLDGRTLRDVLEHEAPLEMWRSISLMVQTAAAVEAAHEAGIIHRDLKPANIFIVQRKSAPPLVKVLDFGIAKLAADSVEDGESKTLTQVGVMIGTPRYMSPEQCDGAKLTPASDVYSLGIILYEMLTGTTPFTGASPLAIALKHSSQPPPRPSEIVAGIPAELEQLVLHALEKNPHDRPPDAGAFHRELCTVAEHLGLDRATGCSTGTLETLRSAGTETPSGRLVIDIERLREKRAAAPQISETTVLADTSEKEIRHTDSASAAVTNEEFSPRPHAFTRVKVFLGRRQTWLYWLKQPPILISICLAALVLIIGVAALVNTQSSNQPLPENDEETATPTPTPGDASPSPEPTPAEGTNERKREKPPEDTRRTSKATRPAPAKKQPPKGGFFNKLKRIFKNPF